MLYGRPNVGHNLVVLTFCPQGGVTSRQTHWGWVCRIIIQASACSMVMH